MHRMNPYLFLENDKENTTQKNSCSNEASV